MALPIVTIGTVHLVNSSGTPTPGGDPTVVSTTPFAIRRGWTLTAPEPQNVWGGGPPFVSGRQLAYLSYDNVVERIPISIAGSSHENALVQLQLLKRTLSQRPVLLTMREASASALFYTEIYSGYLREVTEQQSGFEAWEGWNDIDAELILTRAPFFGATGLQTLINAATFTNVGTGANNNTQALGTLFGDLIYEGQPLNVKFGRPTTTTTLDVYLGIVASRTYLANAGTGSTTGTVTLTPTPAAFDVTAVRGNPNLKVRVIARTASISNGAQLLMRYAAMGRQTLGPWVLVGGASGTSYVDLGYISPTVFQTPLPTTVDLDLQFDIKSADGTTTVGTTLDYIEVLLYYTWCKITPYGGSLIAGQAIQTIMAQNRNTALAWLPQNPPLVQTITTATSKPVFTGTSIGRLPVGISGASLYAAWVTGGTNAHLKTDTTTITVTFAQLYTTLRGNN
jgi:hypothetical protein